MMAAERVLPAWESRTWIRQWFGLLESAQAVRREMTRLDAAAARRRVESLSLHAKARPCRPKRHSRIARRR
jgi:hypothetical protein